MSLNGLTRHIDPATKVDTKTPAPNNSPSKSSEKSFHFKLKKERGLISYLPGLACETLANEENMSGAPFPRAMIVIPAIFCDNLGL